MTCLGCGSHTSSVLYAFQNGEPCPVCGLSATATLEIQGVRQVQADVRLKEQLEQAIKDRDSAQRELKWANHRLSRMQRELGDLMERLGKPLSEEQADIPDL